MKQKLGQLLRHNYFLVIVLTILIGIAYQDLPRLFYVNDEWLQFGLVRVNGIFAGLDRFTVTDILLGKGRPLGTLINNVIFLFFPYNILPFAILSWIFHLLNSLLVFAIVKKLSRNHFISFIASIFFVSSQISYQSYSWVAASVQVGGSAFFMLLAIYLYILAIDKKIVRLEILSWASLYISYLFKDSTVIAAVFLPLLSFFVRPRTSIKDWSRIYWWLWLGLAAFGLYRMLMLLDIASKGLGALFSPRLIPQYAIYVWNIFYYPVISVAHFFIPFRFMYRAAFAFGDFLYPFFSGPQFAFNRDVVAYTMVSDILSLLLFIPISAVLFLVYSKVKEIRKPFLFALLYYVITMIPYAIYLDHRNSGYIESRYMYVQSLAIGIFFAGAAYACVRLITKYLKNVRLSYVIVSVIVAVFVFKQATILQREMQASAREASDIKHVTIEVKRVFPTLPKNPIIYLDGDRSYFYYPHMKVPLQIGPGYVFFLLYYDQVGSPQLFKKDYWLWQLFVQWYEEVDGKGFGYFYDKEKLRELFKQNKNLSVDQVVGMYYDSKTERINDISPAIKQYLLQ